MRAMKISLACVATLLACVSNQASADPIIELVLDSTNGYSVELEPEAFIGQPLVGFNSYLIIGTNIEFALGTSDIAVFPGNDQIGNGEFEKPKNLVNNSTPFTILVTTSGNKYDAFLTFFHSFDEGDGTDYGTPPDPYNNPGAVFALTPAEQSVPEPSTIVLLLTGAVGLVGYGWRRKKQLAA